MRASAFEELCTLFKGTNSANDEVYREHAPLWKKYLSDMNPGALEKCLEAVEVFIDKADPKIVAIS